MGDQVMEEMEALHKSPVYENEREYSDLPSTSSEVPSISNSNVGQIPKEDFEFPSFSELLPKSKGKKGKNVVTEKELPTESNAYKRTMKILNLLLNLMILK